MNRRDFLKTAGLAAAGLVFANKFTGVSKAMAAASQISSERPKVYFTSRIDADSLEKMYRLVSSPLSGRIAVKLHTGEPHGPNIVPVEWVKQLMAVIPGATVVETNVFYPSPRQTTEGHRETLRTNGWDFCPVDIMDADGEVSLPVPGGKWFREIVMGGNIVNYDSMLVLTHFKGHTMGGFGGSLKNIAIGCASGKTGKMQLHQKDNNPWGYSGERFMENMVESAKAVTAHFGPKMAYINVMRNMSVDCDCAGTAAAPVTTPDTGILASTDILAIDQASVDLIYALPPEQGGDMVRRIESRQGLRQLSYMEEMGMGSRSYVLEQIN